MFGFTEPPPATINVTSSAGKDITNTAGSKREGDDLTVGTLQVKKKIRVTPVTVTRGE